MTRIESLLAARLFVAPQIAGDKIYFVSNLSGRLSLYAMRFGGSVPEPLLPPHLALQNPDLMDGRLFALFPRLGKILVMIDNDGDENYQPMFIPMDGGFPEPAFGDRLSQHRVYLIIVREEESIVYLWAEAQGAQRSDLFRANVESGELVKLGESKYGAYPAGHSADHSRVVTIDAYGAGDHVVYLQEGGEARKLLFGTPLEDRQPGQEVPRNGIGRAHFVGDGQALLVNTLLFSDEGGLGLMPLDNPQGIREVSISGIVHTGIGELEGCEHLYGNRYELIYNIDGCDWLYEGVFDSEAAEMRLEYVVAGEGRLSGGVLKGHYYDEQGDRYVLSFTTATSPAQILTVSGPKRDQLVRHTNERVLGIRDGLLAAGEDYSFTTFDGLRISARLYLPADSSGFQAPYPLVYYIHGGPQGQERPDFVWFSMPLIQHLTLNGFAVFVPNVRGSTGYGFGYMNHVVKDWGGQDRLDHVHAMTKVLPNDPRIDVSRAGVVGRSYGGYMTLTLATRHPELWSAAVDMFGPYDLLTFADRVPETWKPYIRFLVGDPETEQEFLRERSPRTYVKQLQCPTLVIQGKNDPRVWEIESRELVKELRGQGNVVEYLMFEDEGHDVLKYENRVRCYNSIEEFFSKHLDRASD